MFICWYDIDLVHTVQMVYQVKHLWLTISKFTNNIYWKKNNLQTEACNTQ